MTDNVHSLGIVQAPAVVFGKREAPGSTRIVSPAFWDGYDAETLIYDCVYIPHRNIVRMYLPKLVNFARTIKAGRFEVDGHAHKPHLRQFRRFDTIELRNIGKQPDSVVFSFRETKIRIPIHSQQLGLFAGRSTVFTMVKNDDLRWIHDWAYSLHKNHGADAFLICNNGSTRYTSDDIIKTLSSIEGLQTVAVIDAPVTFGPSNSSFTSKNPTDFLQVAVLNLVRDRFLLNARAVLLCDVDEIVTTHNGTDIFEATVKSLLSYKLIAGSWRFAANSDAPASHWDHIETEPDAPRCASKYCIVPDSFLGRMCWGVHCLENVNRRLVRPRGDFTFLHCRSITTGWKASRTNSKKISTTVQDASAKAFFDHTFTKAARIKSLSIHTPAPTPVSS